MDEDGDGELSAAEFRSGLGMLGMDQTFAQILFNSFDHDRSGSINKSEFLASMAVMLHPSDMEEQVSMAFDAYDTNRNGRLEMDELHNVLSAMFSTMCKMGIRDEALEPSVESAAAELYRHMDREEKGYVTKDDYLRLAKSNPEMLKRLGLGTRQGQRSGSRILRSSLHQQMNQMIKQRATGESGGLTPAKEPGASSGSTPKRNTISGTLYGVPPIITRRRGRGTGKTVTFGHDNWELVVQMMLAIRLSVGRAIKLAKEAARKSDDKGDVSTPKKGSKKNSTRMAGVPAPSAAEAASAPQYDDMSHPLTKEMFSEIWKTTIPGNRKGKVTDIDFKDYAPLVFRRIRSLFGISDRDYMLSLGPEQILGELLLGTMGSLAELFSEGKSGSFFYFSNDGRYLIKTIPHRELRSLVTILEKYVAHVEAQPFTLLPRFMGAHRIQMPGRRKPLHFVVMTNVFSSPRVIHEVRPQRLDTRPLGRRGTWSSSPIWCGRISMSRSPSV